MKKKEIIEQLPAEWNQDLTPSIRQSLLQSKRTIVVLDDDPTGTQTVYDVPVLTRLDEATLTTELRAGPPVLFLLTNSRSMTPAQSKSFHVELVTALKSAARTAKREVEIISRSDSTLRGHFPLETDVIADIWPAQADLVLLMPFFLEGVRLTIGGQHYVGEADQLVPAHETPFANDVVFGFKYSFMPDYVQEKTSGRVLASEVVLIPIEVIRKKGPAGVQYIFENAPTGSVCVADGVTDSDAQIVAAAVGNCSRKILARVAASYVRACSGLKNRPLMGKTEFSDGESAGNGGLIVVGSHVPKTTAQLNSLIRQHSELKAIEVSVAELMADAATTQTRLIGDVDAALNEGQHVVLFTSRELVHGQDDADNLRISKLVSTSLVEIVKRITTPPAFLVAKGGITSSDIATEALGVERAMVAGSILPGVPVWKLGTETKFPGMHLVIFPGNVGGDIALAEAFEKLRS